MFRFTIRDVLWLTALVALAPPAIAQEVNPAAALAGEWEIVEMIFRGKVQDFSGKPGGWIWFRKGEFAIAYSTREGPATRPCTIRPREIDIQPDPFARNERVIKAHYDLQGESLRIVWRDDYGDRPMSFDAQKDSHLTLYVLKKSK